VKKKERPRDNYFRCQTGTGWFGWVGERKDKMGSGDFPICKNRLGAGYLYSMVSETAEKTYEQASE
jgi:hypothetical protein